MPSGPIEIVSNFCIIFSLLVAVLVTFFVCRTPLHLERAIFTIMMVTNWWQDDLLKYHETLKLAAGKS